MRFVDKLRIVSKTLFFVFTVSFISYCYYFYQSQAKIVELKTIEKIEAFKVSKPDFEHDSHQSFLDSVNTCVDYIYNTTSDIMPVNRELLLAQAALESAWGTSRFAIEGKNLFGIRTYDLREPHMLPWKDKPQKWGVKVFPHECDSVQNYMDILNNGTAFEKYREVKYNGENDPFKLVETLDAYATDKHYFSKIRSIITKIRAEYKLNYIR